MLTSSGAADQERNNHVISFALDVILREAILRLSSDELWSAERLKSLHTLTISYSERPWELENMLDNRRRLFTTKIFFGLRAASTSESFPEKRLRMVHPDDRDELSSRRRSSALWAKAGECLQGGPGWRLKVSTILVIMTLKYSIGNAARRSGVVFLFGIAPLPRIA